MNLISIVLSSIVKINNFNYALAQKYEICIQSYVYTVSGYNMICICFFNYY